MVGTAERGVILLGPRSPTRCEVRGRETEVGAGDGEAGAAVCTRGGGLQVETRLWLLSAAAHRTTRTERQTIHFLFSYFSPLGYKETETITHESISFVLNLFQT